MSSKERISKRSTSSSAFEENAPKQVFDKFGSNGELPTEKIVAAIKELFKTKPVDLTEDNLALILKRADRNGDGKLDWKEFNSLISFMNIAFSEFVQIDKNNSNKLSASELQEAWTNLDYEFTDQQIKMFITVFDEDKSGGIEFSEYLNLAIFLRELEHHFSKRDVDNSGDLDVQELRYVMRDLRLPNSTRRAARLLNELDTEKVGTVSFEGFVQLVLTVKNGKKKCGVQKKQSSEPKKKPVVREPSVSPRTDRKSTFGRTTTSANMPEMVIRSHFAKYDTDESGDINVNELQQLCYDLGYYFDGSQMSIIFAGIDTGNDSSINWNEFLNWWRTSKKFDKIATLEDDSMAQSILYFQYFDVGRTGYLNADEFAALFQDLKRNNLVNAEDDVGQAMASLDKDSDGVIKFNEFIEWMGLANK